MTQSVRASLKRPANGNRGGVSPTSVLVIALITGLLFIIIEFGLSHVGIFTAIGFPLPTYEVSGSQVGDYTPDQNSVSQWVISRPFRYRITLDGFRDSIEFKLQSKRSPLRVLCLGDSFTFGSFVNDDEAFPHKLGHLLTDHLGFGPEVINAGFGGYSIRDQLEYYKEKGRSLQPDLVVLGVYVGNDFSDLQSAPFRQSLKGPRLVDRIKRVASRYYTYQALVYLKMRLMLAMGSLNRPSPTAEIEFIETARASDSDEESVPRPAAPEFVPTHFADVWPEYVDLLSELVHATSQDGSELLVVIFPHYVQLDPARPAVIQERFAELCSSLDVACLDLLPAMRRKHAEGIFQLFSNPLHAADDHPTASGHELAAFEIYRRMTSDSRFSRLLSSSPGG